MTRLLADSEIAALVAAAGQVRERAYAPYSGFAVGAAVVADDTRVYLGCNVENASYGLSLCAERAAVAAAVAAGAVRIAAVVLVSDTAPPATPCGACRQWLAELGCGDTEIICSTLGGRFARYRLSQMLPEAFTRKP